MLAISQAICQYRQQQKIDGPLFLGIDTHALSEPAAASALEVLAANGVEVMLAERRRVHADAGRLARDPDVQPRPHDRPGRRHRDHAVAQSAGERRLQVQPAERRPGGHRRHRLDRDAGPTSSWADGLGGLKRMPLSTRAARGHHAPARLSRTRTSSDLGNVIDMEAIRGASLRLGVDPLGGAGVHYWAAIAERYGLDLTVVSDEVDPTFRFMTVDWDGQIRMDPSSPYAMRRLIGLQGQLRRRLRVRHRPRSSRDRHRAAPACCRPITTWRWPSTISSSTGPGGAPTRGGRQDGGQQPDDRSRRRQARPHALRGAGRLQVVRRRACSTARWASAARRARAPRSSGATALSWTTDKDGIAPALLAAEITARAGRDPGELYRELTREFGEPAYDRVEAPATPEQKARLSRLSPEQVASTDLAGEQIQSILDPRARQRRPHRRPEGHRRDRLVRRAPLRHRGHLQDLRRELPGPRPPTPHPARSPSPRRRNTSELSALLISR